MSKPNREANMELLRITAMLMVVVMHYLNHADALLTLGLPMSAVRVAGTLIESFCIAAVNVYVMISGYFLAGGGYRPKKAVILVCQILFYALIVPLVFVLPGLVPMEGENRLYHLIQYIFPLETEHYWFATSYVLLYLFSPLLTTAVRHLSKRQLQITLGGLFFLFCFVKSISPVKFAFDRFGYDFGWFICVFLLAAYMRLYGFSRLRGAGRAAAVYIGSALLSFALVFAAYEVNSVTGGLAYYFTVPFHYNFFLCLTGAVGLFCLFKSVSLREGRMARAIRRVAPLTFGVYLFHEHVDLRGVWFGRLGEIFGPVPSGLFGFLLHMAVTVLAVYAAGLFIDWVRSVIFGFAARYLHHTRLNRLLDRLDGEFAPARGKGGADD